MTQPPSSYFACPVPASASSPFSSSSSSAASLQQGLPSPTSPALSVLDIPPTSTSPSTMDHTPEPTAANSTNPISVVSTNPISPSSLSPSTSLKGRRSPSPLPLPRCYSDPDIHTVAVPGRVARSGEQCSQQSAMMVPSTTSTSSTIVSPSQLAVSAAIPVFDSNSTPGRSRTPSSTSTPPPSPPLAATASSSSPSTRPQSNGVSEEPSGISSMVSAAAAAAAAASYTSQELAIAYSMVTSTQQNEAQELEDDNHRTKALFSLDEEQKEFTTDMYIAMRNRIFELEAKTVNYAPFNRTSFKRPADRLAPLDEYHYSVPLSNTPGHFAGTDLSRPSKRSAYHHISHHHPPHPEHPHYAGVVNSGSMRTGVRPSASYPSWYSPEAFFSHHRSQNPPYTARHPQTIEREREQHHRASRTQHPIASTLMDTEGHVSGSRVSSTSVGHSPRVQRLPVAPAQPPAIQPRPILPNGDAPIHASTGRTSPPSHSHKQPAIVESVESANAAAAAAVAAAQQRQSFHQRQHRAQQQAQSDYSRSYHLQKHMRMMDQKRAALLAQQQQHQQQQQQQHQQQQQQLHHQSPAFKPIQRHYQSHQQMYSSSTKSEALQPQIGTSPLHIMSPPQQHQQRLKQYQQQRQLLFQQQQARQLLYLRQRGLSSKSAASNGTGSLKHLASPTLSLRTSSSSPSPSVDSTSKKKKKWPVECFNCMALDSLTWRPRTSDSLSSFPISDGSSAMPSPSSRLASIEGRYLCTACLQYLQAHGHCRPVPPFSVNFLKKIHCRFKKELQIVRFQGWQDAQVLEIEDHISAQNFQLLSEGLGGASVISEAAVDQVDGTKRNTISSSTTEGHEDKVVIKIEDSDDEDSSLTAKTALNSPARMKNKDIKSTFQSEAAVGDFFGHRWKTEPMVGYTLVHFGGTDRTRMVPMNPTVPSLTVTFQPESESITFAFRVLVNGLCLLSTGGGPPALHMPEMTGESDDSDHDESPPKEKSRSPPAESSADTDGKVHGSSSPSHFTKETKTSKAPEPTVNSE
ncbi:hypothetical protein EMPS_04178 [Entomortierella parvispora]|uniref:Uncharacterized protein n=1 Tax=Entomortierella parvispora TaxID=205924 RepID=A0A9P3H853_9FUNG|nr:hypothetical protein EMPS_04178 [Entomortierella parvispora]